MISPTQAKDSSQETKNSAEGSLNQRIEQTLLSPNATKTQFKELLLQALQFQFFGVCLPPVWVSWAKDFLRQAQNSSSLKLISVVGFPHGNSLTETKAFEAQALVQQGADEIDMVINLHNLKNGEFQRVVLDIKNVKEAIQKSPLKVIIETALLSKEEIAVATKLCAEAGADFVKTCTGFQGGAASVEDVQLIRKTLDDIQMSQVKIKASGGIRSREMALKLIEAGADRLGTSSGHLILNPTLSGSSASY